MFIDEEVYTVFFDEPLYFKDISSQYSLNDARETWNKNIGVVASKMVETVIVTTAPHKRHK